MEQTFRVCLEADDDDWREEIRSWPGPGDVLKRTVWWPSGQVRTDNAVSDASYIL
jgi:hypothetical protein